MINNKLFRFLNSLNETSILIVMAYIRLNGRCSTTLNLCYLDVQILKGYSIKKEDYPFIEDWYSRNYNEEDEKIAA